MSEQAGLPTVEEGPWKCGALEVLPYHPSASHVHPDFRDGWNACWKALQNASLFELPAGERTPPGSRARLLAATIVDEMQAAIINGELPIECEDAADWLEKRGSEMTAGTMTSGYHRKVHLAGFHCKSASGSLPPPTRTLTEFLATPLRQRCITCTKHVHERAEKEQK